jgi:archaellum component FlaC
MTKDEALKTLEQKRADYEAGRKRLVQITDRIDRQKRSVLTLDQDIKALDKQWRDELRKKDGVVSDSVRTLQAQKSQSEEAATEIDTMIQEVELHLEDACKEVKALRSQYLSALSQARIITEKENMGALIEQSKAYPGTPDLLSAIKDSLAIAEQSAFDFLSTVHPTGWITHRDEGKRELAEAVHAAQAKRLLEIFKTLTDIDQGHELASEKLTVLQPISAETPPSDQGIHSAFTSVMRISR